MVEVLLVGKDWRARALLRAQLIEEGVEVEAHDSVQALGNVPALPHPRARFPKLLVADVSASEDLGGELDRLAAWTKYVSVWIIASRSTTSERELLGRGFGAVLFRPVDVAELVDRIKQRIKGVQGPR